MYKWNANAEYKTVTVKLEYKIISVPKNEFLLKHKSSKTLHIVSMNKPISRSFNLFASIPLSSPTCLFFHPLAFPSLWFLPLTSLTHQLFISRLFSYMSFKKHTSDMIQTQQKQCIPLNKYSPSYLFQHIFPFFLNETHTSYSQCNFQRSYTPSFHIFPVKGVEYIVEKYGFWQILHQTYIS